MQRLNNSAATPLIQTLQSLVNKASEVLIVQQQFWGDEAQQQGTLKTTVDAGQVTFEHVFSKTHSLTLFLGEQ